MQSYESIDRHFARNTFGISAVEVLWGLGLPLIVESTFLQLFLKNLGARNQVIGLIPALLSTGISLCSLLSAYLTTHLVHKRKAVILTHMLVALPLLTMGILFLVFGKNEYSVTIFLIFYFIGALCFGVCIPVWQNFLVKIFSKTRVIRALGIMMISQTIARLIGSLLIVKYTQRYAFSAEGSGMVIILLAVFFFAGSFFFLIVHEEVNDADEAKSAHNISNMINAAKAIIGNRNYITFLLNTIEAFACIGIISFYANFAAEYHGISRAYAAGLFVGFISLGSLTAYILFGFLDIFNLKKKYIVSRLCSLVSVLLLITVNTLAGFLTVSFFLGVSRGISMLAYSPAIKKLSREDDATDYFAISPMLSLPFGIGIPVAAGFFLDRFAAMGALSYKILFGAMGGLIVFSLVMLMLIDFD